MLLVTVHIFAHALVHVFAPFSLAFGSASVFQHIGVPLTPTAITFPSSTNQYNHNEFTYLSFWYNNQNVTLAKLQILYKENG